MSRNELCVNELLFYVQNVIHSTPKDVIIDACVKFYSLDEISEGFTTLESALNIRLSKRHKSDDLATKLMTDIYDKMWSVDTAATSIPSFVASDLARVPRARDDSDSLASTEQVLSSIHSMKCVIKQGQQTKVACAQLIEILPKVR